jgi:transcriptional regulator
MTARELDLLQGTLDLLVLRALAWSPMHGYGIARFIRKGSEGSLQVLDGALYTCLHRLEGRGWVESEWGHAENGKRARFYRLTAAGRRARRNEAASWHHYVTSVARVLESVPRPTGDTAG